MVNNNNDRTTIGISKKLRNKLGTLGNKNETFEEVIWKLVNPTKRG